MARVPLRRGRNSTPFFRFAGAASVLGGTLRIATSFVAWDPGAWWLEGLALVIDLALLFALMGVYVRSMDRLGTWGLVTFIAAEAGLASIVGPDTVAFGIDTYQTGVVVISVALALFGVEHLRGGTAFTRAAWLWLASTLTASLAMAAGAAATGVVLGGVLFGLGFVVAGLALHTHQRDDASV